MEAHREAAHSQKVHAGGEEIGEVVAHVSAEDVEYLHVRRYGPGEDDLYIPSFAVDRVVGDRVYLNLSVPELVGKAWHHAPGTIDD